MQTIDHRLYIMYIYVYVSLDTFRSLCIPRFLLIEPYCKILESYSSTRTH